MIPACCRLCAVTDAGRVSLTESQRERIWQWVRTFIFSLAITPDRSCNYEASVSELIVLSPLKDISAIQRFYRITVFLKKRYDIINYHIIRMALGPKR